MTTPAVRRPAPKVATDDYRPHFDALAEGRIVAPRCTGCGTKFFPKPLMCPVCHAVQFEWVDMPREGRIYTFTVVHRAFNPWFKQHGPYGVVVADLGDGVRILGACFDKDLDQLQCDAPVVADFIATDGLTLLGWKVAAPRSAA